MLQVNYEHSYKLDNIRGIAILFVVFGHSIIIYSDSWNLYSTVYHSVVLNNVKRFIDLAQMPLFFAISGYLFVSTMKRKFIHIIIYDKFKRLIIPYIIFAICWLIPIKKMIDYPGYRMPLFEVFWRCIVLGEDNGHLWYLISLFECFIIRIIVEYVSEAIFPNKHYENIPIGLIVSAILSIAIILGRTFKVSIFYKMPLYLVWFVLGEIINSSIFNTTMERYRNRIYEVTIFTIIIVLFTYSVEGAVNRVVSLIASSVIVFYFFVFIPDKNIPALTFLAEVSFGVYLIHSPLIYITFTFLPNINPLFVILLNFVVFGSISCCLAYLLKNSRLRVAIGS